MLLLPALLWSVELGIGSPTGLPVASETKLAVDGAKKAGDGVRAADASAGVAGKPQGDGHDTAPTDSGTALQATIDRLRSARGTKTAKDLRAWPTSDVSSFRAERDLDGRSSAATAELLSLVAEIAVRRAKRNGLAYLQEIVTDGVCRLKQGPLPLFPATCDVLKGTSLERLAGDPETLMVALASDLFLAVDPTTNSRLTGGMRTLVTGGVTLVARVASTRGGRFGAQDTREITEMLLRQAEQYNKGNIAKNRGVAVGLGAGAVMVAGYLEGSTLSAVSVLTALEAKTGALTPEQWAEALTLAGLVYRAAGGDSEGGPDAARVQVVAGLQATFLVLNSVAPCESAACMDYRASLEGITLGAAERNVPRVLSSSVKFLVRLIHAASFRRVDALAHSTAAADKDMSKVDEADIEKVTAERAQLEKLITVLAALAAYAETHDPAKTEGKSAEELRKARKEVLEGVIDAVTVRSGRGGKWVGSLGVTVGFTAVAGQWIKGADGKLNHGTVIAPQLALPLGFAVQRLPGRASNGAREGQRFFANGVHFFVSAMDLGQFLAYDGQGKLSPPTWSSFIAPGAQVAWALGRPNNMLLIGAEARYAPTLFSTTPNDTDPGEPGGALRVGLFVAYYIPLLDFN